MVLRVKSFTNRGRRLLGLKAWGPLCLSIKQEQQKVSEAAISLSAVPSFWVSLRKGKQEDGLKFEEA